jgi:hypothetical protein
MRTHKSAALQCVLTPARENLSASLILADFIRLLLELGQQQLEAGM